jgi:ABC-type Fe3+-hydroxamate transport system substrate-binding protein
MKNLFKFGFLGLAITVATAACNSTSSETEQTADSLANEIEAQVEATTDSIDSIGEAAIDSLDSLAN